MENSPTQYQTESEQPTALNVNQDLQKINIIENKPDLRMSSPVGPPPPPNDNNNNYNNQTYPTIEKNTDSPKLDVISNPTDLISVSGVKEMSQSSDGADSTKSDPNYENLDNVTAPDYLEKANNLEPNAFDQIDPNKIAAQDTENKGRIADIDLARSLADREQILKDFNNRSEQYIEDQLDMEIYGQITNRARELFPGMDEGNLKKLVNYTVQAVRENLKK